MAIQVYTSEKPAISRRAWFASILLLSVTSVLAWAMTRSRSGEVLGRRIEPAGWSISFRPPRALPTGAFGPTEFGVAYRFYGQTPHGDPVLLSVFRLEGAVVGDSLTVCERVLRAHPRPPLPIVHLSRLTRYDRKLGPFEAVEIWDPQLGIVVRAAVLNSREVYAISLRAPGYIDPRSYRLFDSMCSSIEHRGY
jgi:hypothetical protein